MKRGFIFGGILVLIGFIMITIGNILGNNRAFHLDEESVEKTYTFSGQYEEIIYSDLSSSILIKPSPDENIHFTAYESEDKYYEIKDGANLEIQLRDDSEWDKEFFSIDMHNDFSKYKAELLIPESMQPRLSIENRFGAITVQDLVLEDLDIDGENGAIKINNLTTIEDFAVESRNGGINIQEVKAKDFEVTNQNGTVTLDTVDADNVSVENMNGKIEISDTYSNSDVDIDNLNGKIAFNKLGFEGKLTAENTNGGIEGELLGSAEDYQFKLSSVVGGKKVNGYEVGEGSYGSGSKVVVIETVNGAINVNTEN